VQAKRLSSCGQDGTCSAQEKEEEAGGVAGLAGRTFVGGIVVFCLVAPSLAARILRNLPATMQDERKVSGAASHGKQVQYTRLDVVRYRAEYWFSTSAYSKPLALLFMTVWLALLGAGSLFAFTGATWRVVFWRAVAGIGLDWTPAAGEDSESEATMVQRLCGLILAVGGTVVTALLVSIISDLFSEQMDELRTSGGDVRAPYHPRGSATLCRH
jgi:hypothetical protein